MCVCVRGLESVCASELFKNAQSILFQVAELRRPLLKTLSLFWLPASAPVPSPASAKEHSVCLSVCVCDKDVVLLMAVT